MRVRRETNIIEAADLFNLDLPLTRGPVGMARNLEDLESATLFLRWLANNTPPGTLRDEALEHYRNLKRMRAELPEGGLLWVVPDEEGDEDDPNATA